MKMLKSAGWAALFGVAIVAIALTAQSQQTVKTLPKFKIVKSESEWRKLLTPPQFHILREKGTEPAYKNKYWDHHAKGTYVCAATRKPLFSSKDKYDSKTGWPSFTRSITPDAVLFVKDEGHGMSRIEVVDALSGSHLGHVFNDGPAPTGKRFCMNSEALIFVPDRK